MVLNQHPPCTFKMQLQDLMSVSWSRSKVNQSQKRPESFVFMFQAYAVQGQHAIPQPDVSFLGFFFFFGRGEGVQSPSTCATLLAYILCYSLKPLLKLSGLLKYLECCFSATLCLYISHQFLDQNVFLQSLHFVENPAPPATASVFLFSCFYVS